MENDCGPFSGYDLAERVFVEAHEDPVSAYIDLVGDETSWLEFKAGMYAREEDREDPRENEEDNFWHISKAILAMLNSSGGVVVIGVQDQTFQPVDLAANDPRHVLEEQGPDAYVRLVVEKNLPPDRKSWSTGCYGPWLFDRPIPSGHICFERATYKGHLVVLVFVKPFNDCRTARHGNKEVMLVRRPGARGRVDELTTYEQFRDWERQRTIRHEKFDSLYQQFCKRQDSLAFEATLDTKIDAYYETLARQARDEMAVFTPLDAEENVFEAKNVDSFYSPEAVEWKDSSSSWLTDDSDDDDKEDVNGYDMSGSESDEDDEDNTDQSFDEGDSDSNNDDSVRRGDLLTLLDENPRAIVSGEPGGGKTTCLTYFALRFQKTQQEQKTLAVFIPMGQWRHGGSLLGMVLKATNLDLPQLESLLSSNRIRLVIDAVNECPDHFRAAAILNVQQFLATHPSTPVVLSTRHPEELSSLELPVFQVQPMDENHRRKYLERYLGDSELAERLLSQLRTMPGGDTIAENPMLLRLVVEVYRESPMQTLPPGRAGLYRRSLRSWYKREKGKREDSGEELPFSRKEALSHLAELAFKSRMKGYRSVPEEEVSSIWGDSSRKIIAEICQGPVVYRDTEFIRFRHETFQEYLAAEYLENHIDELPDWTQDDYSRWGMPFAYLIELLESDGLPIPESIWLVAWSMNPWLGVALTDPKIGRMLETKTFSGTRPSIFGHSLGAIESGEPVGKVFLDAIAARFSKQLLQKALHKPKYPWYSRFDTPLQYSVTVSKRSHERWQRFEISQVGSLRGLWDKYAIVLANSWIVLKNPRDIFQYHIPDDWEKWIQEATPQSAIGLLRSGIAILSDFNEVKTTWDEDLTSKPGIELYRLGVLDLNDIEPKFSTWVEYEGLFAIARLLSSGLISKSSPFVSDIVEKAKRKQSPKTACMLIQKGIADKETFSDSLSVWHQSKNPKHLIHLLRQGLICLRDIPMEQMISMFSPDDACNLIQSGMAQPNDFSPLLPHWFLDTQYSYVRDYIIQTCDPIAADLLRTKLPTMISEANLHSAILLVKDNLVLKDDFRSRFLAFAAFAEPEQIAELLQSGMLSRDDVFQSIRNRERFQSFEVQSIVDGKIEAMINEGAIVNVEGAYGILRRKDFYWAHNALKEEPVSIGQTHRFKVIMSKGVLFLGLKQLKTNPWHSVEDKFVVGADILGIVKECVKGGLIVEIDGWTAFLPNTQLSNEAAAPSNEYIGKNMLVRIIKTDPYLNSIIVSRRLILEEEKTNKQREILTSIQVGEILCGCVKKLTNFGAFVDIGGVDGLIHINDLSWGRIRHPDDILQCGQKLEVVVLDVDLDLCRVSLGYKQLQQNPWDTIDRRYPVGTRVHGKVNNLPPYGAFVELEPGIEGLVHISEFSWTQKVARASDMLNTGDEVDAVVISVDKDNHRIALSIRATQKNPCDSLPDGHPVGSS